MADKSNNKPSEEEVLADLEAEQKAAEEAGPIPVGLTQIDMAAINDPPDDDEDVDGHTGRTARYGPKPDVCNLAAALHELEQCNDAAAFRSVSKRYCAWVDYDASELDEILDAGHKLHKIPKAGLKKTLTEIQKVTKRINNSQEQQSDVFRLLEDRPDALPDLENFRYIAGGFIDANYRDEKTGMRTICQWSGAPHYWNGNRWQEFDQGELDAKTRLWLEDAVVIRRTDGGAQFEEVKPDLQLIKQTTTATMDRVRRPSDSLNTMRLESGKVEKLGHHFLAVNNGILNMKTGELIDATPAFFNVNAIAADWRPEYVDMTAEELQGAIDGTVFGEYIDAINEHDPLQKDVMGEFFGYSLTTDTTEGKILGLWGAKRSGKGTYMRTIEAMLPDQTTAISATTFSGGSHMAPLVGKTVATWADLRISDRSDPAPTIENLLNISGEDNQSISRKYLPNWEGRLHVKIIIASNSQPDFRDQTGTLSTRFVHLEFPKTFYGREDKELSNKIAKEKDHILAWAVGNWRKLKQRGGFTVTNTGDRLERRMRYSQNPVEALYDKWIEYTGNPDDFMPKDAVFAAMLDATTEHGMTGFTKNGLTRGLQRRIPSVEIARKEIPDLDGQINLPGYGTGKRVRGYTGIRWKRHPTPTEMAYMTSLVKEAEGENE